MSLVVVFVSQFITSFLPLFSQKQEEPSFATTHLPSILVCCSALMHCFLFWQVVVSVSLLLLLIIHLQICTCSLRDRSNIFAILKAALLGLAFSYQFLQISLVYLLSSYCFCLIINLFCFILALAWVGTFLFRVVMLELIRLCQYCYLIYYMLI